jgi:AraC family transcriptional regulator of arabinose operon
MRVQDTAKRNKYYHCLEYDHDQSGDICLVACGMEQCDPGVNYGPDVRDCYHLHVILSGKGILYTGGKVFHPHFGQMFLLKDNEVAQYTADAEDPWNYCWVTYNGTEALRISEEIGFTDGVYCMDSAIEGKAFFELICRMHEQPEMNYINDLRRRGILLEFLALALEATETRTKKNSRRNEVGTEVYISRAIDFIHYNYATITVGDIIAYIGFTRSYFTTIFKRQVGISPQEYLIQYRLQQGCRMLLETELSVQEIAMQIGYENPLNFSRGFKHAYGISPTEYRQKERSKIE